MREEALGLVEVIGLLAAIEAADTGLKSANVSLIEIENATGAYLTVKFSGDVGAVNAAVSAARISAGRVGKVVSVHVIPRPARGLRDTWLRADETKAGEEAEGSLSEEHQEQKPLEQPDTEAQKASEVRSEEEEIPESEQEAGSNAEPAPAEEILPKEVYTCNLCKDPKCPREKGQPAALCIHGDNKRGKNK